MKPGRGGGTEYGCACIAGIMGGHNCIKGGFRPDLDEFQVPNIRKNLVLELRTCRPSAQTPPGWQVRVPGGLAETRCKLFLPTPNARTTGQPHLSFFFHHKWFHLCVLLVFPPHKFFSRPLTKKWCCNGTLSSGSHPHHY